METIVEADHITFRYAEEDGGTGENALNNFSLRVDKGSFVAILGANGSGKSTFARHVNAILVPSEGKLLVAGMDTAKEENLLPIRQHAGMVFQNPDNQLVAAVVEEDVAFAPENLGLPPDEIRARVDNALREVDMYEYRYHAPSQLSGGQKQRIAIAGVIAMEPECIVFDEPTAMLDPKGRQEVMDAACRLCREKGVTILLITHYMEEAVLADRVVIMQKGQIVMDDTPRRVFSQVEKVKSLGLDVPQVTELAWELRQAGYEMPADIITENECLEALTRLLTHERGGESPC